MARKKHKNRYILVFCSLVLILAVVRCVFLKGSTTLGEDDNDAMTEENDTTSIGQGRTKYLAKGERPHRVLGVRNYDEAFPDSNHVQIVAAQHWGVERMKDRQDAEQRKDEVVFMGCSPYYSVAKLDASIPYLVPRAAILMEDIARNFLDSQQVKGIPLHLMQVSSVLRSEEDVARLRRSNKNATEQSCHLYGTTFDINYNVYTPVGQQTTSSDRLKMVLGEVLDDLRQQGRCYVKYEKRQPCFHITVR